MSGDTVLESNLTVNKDTQLKQRLDVSGNTVLESNLVVHKDVSMNKLDTHLTNLKNQIIKDLDIIINFQSQDKTLKLLID